MSSVTKLLSVDGPFVTVYADTHGNVENAEAALATRWKNILRELSDAGVDERTQEALTQARGDVGQGTRVLVAAHGAVHLATSLPTPPPRDEVAVGPLPRLLPLVEAMSTVIPHVLVLVDRTGADVYAYTTEPEPVERRTVDSDRFPQRKVRFGGWATKRWSNDVEETWEASARDVAALVDRVARDIDTRVILASGDDRALELLREHLPTERHSQLHTIGGGGRHVDGGEAVIMAGVLEALEDIATGYTIDLLDRFAGERARHQLAADGVTATVAAAQRGQLETLLLADTRDDSRMAWCGSEPGQVGLSAAELRGFGVEAPEPAPLTEILVRAALGTDAAIHVVNGGMEQAPSEGVGALLRFVTEPLTAATS